jgi:diguanylate cyclase (GGDEF)-like protein
VAGDLLEQEGAEVEVDRRALRGRHGDDIDALGAFCAAPDAVLDNMPLLLVSVDWAGRVTRARGGLALSRAGIDPGRVVGEPLADLVGADAPLLAVVAAVLESGGDEEATPIRWSMGRLVLDGYVVAARDARGTICGADIMAIDVADRAPETDTEHALAWRVLHDDLTDLPNRVLGLDRLDLQLRHLDRAARALLVLLVDIDRFQLVNDNLGYEAGDELLVTVADAMRRVCDGSDIVSRIGGDEFLVVHEVPLPSSGSTTVAPVDAAARSFVATLQAAIGRPVCLAGEDVRPSACIGVATTICELGDAPVLVRNANSAVQQAKLRGPGSAALFDERWRTATSTQLRQENDLRSALIGRDLELHFQPVLDLSTGALVGLETLLRWQHPERGLVAPGEFIPLAERSELILEVGAWVLEEACRQHRQWWAGVVDSPYLAVNVSVRQMREASFASMVKASLLAAGVPPDRLVLEVTETTLIDDDPDLERRLEELRGIGVRLAVDDFGTGFSSLAYLHRFPFDLLKIDRSFVGRLEEDPALAEAIVAMADALGLETIAEGVETDAQLDVLRSIHCHSAQGFLFSRPKPVGALGDLRALDHLMRHRWGPAA